MPRLVVLAATLLATGAPATAGGVYFLESFGVGRSRGELAPSVGNAIHTRLAVGGRWRWLALEPWITTELQTEREGAWRGLVGGEPAAGRADLAAYGVHLKLIAPLHVSPGGARLDGYLRGGPGLASGTGLLEGYAGTMFGAAAGVQVTGEVRVLGFLWTPLFFLQRGPKVTGALFLDQGYDVYRLRKDGDEIVGYVGHVSVGFALGSAF